MPRPEKVQAVEDIKARIDGAQAVFLTEYRGLSVKAQQTLRRALRDSGADYKVVKMTLARIAASELGHADVAEEMVGPTAIAFANTDAVATAKALDTFAKENDAFVLKGGILSGSYLAPEQVSALAKLPSRPELLGKIAGAMKAPLFKAAGLFAGFNRAGASMFSQLLEKKEAGDPIAGAGGAAVESEAAPATDTPSAETDDTPVADAAVAAEESAGPAEEAEAETPEAATEAATDDSEEE